MEVHEENSGYLEVQDLKKWVRLVKPGGAGGKHLICGRGGGKQWESGGVGYGGREGSGRRRPSKADRSQEKPIGQENPIGLSKSRSAQGKADRPCAEL